MNTKNYLVTYLLNFAMEHDIGYDLVPCGKEFTSKALPESRRIIINTDWDNQDEFDSEHQITGKTFNVSPSKYTINPQNKLNDEYITLSLTLISDDFDIPEGTHTYFVTAALTDNNKSPQNAIVDTARTWFATRKI